MERICIMAEKARRVADSRHYTDTVNALTALLKNGNEADRCYAAQALGKIKDQTTIPLLIEKLRDEDVDVCSDAATALGAIGHVSALPALLESLNNDPDGEVLMVVVDALGCIDDPEAIKALLNISHVCPAHIEELEDDWDYYWDIQLKAVKALGARGIEEATPILLNLLQDEDGQDIESDILAALSKIEISGEDALIRLAADVSARTRRRALIALTKSASKKSLECIGNALSDPAADVREQALVSLEKRAALPYFSAILKLMADNKENVRARAMEVALHFSSMVGKSHALIDTAKTMIRDRHEKARITALNILYNLLKEKENVESISAEEEDFFDEDLIDSLNKSMLMENGNEVIAAMRLLTLCDDESRDEMLCEALLNDYIDARINHEAALLLANTEPTAAIIEALEKTITHENQAVRHAALNALSKFPAATEDALCPRQIMLDIINPHIEEEVEAKETEALEEETEEEAEVEETSAEDDTAPASTIAAIEQDNDDVAKKLATNTHFEPKNIEDTLEELSDDMQEFGQIVKSNMEKFTPISRKRYIDTHLDIRLLSIRLLSDQMGEEDVFETLIHMLDDDNKEIKRAVLTVLGGQDRDSISDEILAKIIDLTSFDNIEIRIDAVRTLGKLGNRDHMEIFISAADDDSSEVRIQALRALESFIDRSNSDIIAHIASHLKDKEYGVRRVAIEILTTLGQHQELGNIIDTGFADGGALSADAGKSAIIFGEDIATPILLAKLEDVPSSAERRFVIEMMQGIYENNQT